DPVSSYTEDEAVFTAQIYEPPLQYHYLKRPFTLIPATLTAMPTVTYIDAAGKALPANAPEKQIAFSVYELHLQPGIKFQPHPAFAVDSAGAPVYFPLKPEQAMRIQTLEDFSQT